MLENNVAVEVIEKIKDDLKKKLVGTPLPRGQIADVIFDTLKESVQGLFKTEEIDLMKKIRE